MCFENVQIIFHKFIKVFLFIVNLKNLIEDPHKFSTLNKKKFTEMYKRYTFFYELLTLQFLRY